MCEGTFVSTKRPTPNAAAAANGCDGAPNENADDAANDGAPTENADVAANGCAALAEPNADVAANGCAGAPKLKPSITDVDVDVVGGAPNENATVVGADVGVEAPNADVVGLVMCFAKPGAGECRAAEVATPATLLTSR